jgi:hypothetical protein
MTVEVTRGPLTAQIVPLVVLMKRVEGGYDFEDRRGARGPVTIQVSSGGGHACDLHRQRPRVPTGQPDRGVVAGREEPQPQRGEPLLIGQRQITGAHGRGVDFGRHGSA